MTPTRTVSACLLPALLVACASQQPVDLQSGPVTEEVAVALLGDGFVRTGDRRCPREAFVLELRQRVRAMTAEHRKGLRVLIEIPEGGDESAARDNDWLLDQLQIMGVPMARYR